MAKKIGSIACGPWRFARDDVAHPLLGIVRGVAGLVGITVTGKVEEEAIFRLQPVGQDEILKSVLQLFLVGILNDLDMKAVMALTSDSTPGKGGQPLV
jgi:hypothetical protein